ncbi:MAG: methionyl-tRNA formyltransferase [Ktedonobacteraceae bacterium]
MENILLNDLSNTQNPRILFFGMQGNFSTPSLSALLESGVEVCAVVVPAPPLPGSEPPPIRRLEPPLRRPLLPLLHTASSVVQLAWERHIPVWEVQRLKHMQTLSILRGYEPDIICVACFSLLVPGAILALPRLGCLNVHPALLPANRGPVPLFWTLREGHRYTGVTIHFMTEEMDSGAILSQERFAVPEGIRYEELEVECARRGGLLLARTAQALFKGSARAIPQDEARSSYHSFPTEADLSVVPQEWSARRLYNFIRGMYTWGGPVELHLASGEHIHARDAISYSRYKHTQAPGLSAMGNEFIVWCKDGHVRVLLSG